MLQGLAGAYGGVLTKYTINFTTSPPCLFPPSPLLAPLPPTLTVIGPLMTTAGWATTITVFTARLFLACVLTDM